MPRAIDKVAGVPGGGPVDHVYAVGFHVQDLAQAVIVHDSGVVAMARDGFAWFAADLEGDLGGGDGDEHGGH